MRTAREAARVMIMIIDLSENNTVTNWDEVKENVEGVILRCAYRGYKYPTIKEDGNFKRYAQACNEKNIPLGIYFMSQAITVAEAKEEAAYIAECARQYKTALPLFIDSEWSGEKSRNGRADSLPIDTRTVITIAFLEEVKAQGFTPGVYACESWFTEHLNYNALREYYIWVADYGENTGEICSIISLPKYDLFQFTSKRKVPGVLKTIDCSVYPGQIPNPEPKELRTITGMPVLRKGATGTAVKIWQVIIGVEPDGQFGPITDKATRDFQEKSLIAKDGAVGPQSWNKGINSF